MNPDKWRTLFQPGDVGASDLELLTSAANEKVDRESIAPMIFIVGVGGLLIWATLGDNRKRRRARA